MCSWETVLVSMVRQSNSDDILGLLSLICLSSRPSQYGLASAANSTGAGTCLTVTAFEKSWFKVGVAPETLRRTNLGALTETSQVNLERAVKGETRMGGHMVQGHVDTIAKIIATTPDENSLVLRLQPRDLTALRYIVEKGFITLDGASLTVTQVKDGEDGWFEIMLIAYTQEKIVTAAKKVGDFVNVEIDVMAKYVEKGIEAYFAGTAGGNMSILEKMVERIVEEKLKR